MSKKKPQSLADMAKQNRDKSGAYSISVNPKPAKKAPKRK